METLLRRHTFATQHNFLIHAPLNLSNVEVIIFSLALAGIHKNDKELPPISMRFTDVFKSTSGSNYASLAKAMDTLVGKRVKMQSITTKRTQIKVYNIISSLEYDSDAGLITGKFSQEIEPYLIALRKNFTSMEVEMLLTLKTAHTHRLAWFLKAHEYQEGVEISLVNLRKILFGEEPGYADYFEFKRKVLNPALSELNDSTGVNWGIKVEEMKKGLRQVIGLRFKIPKLQVESINELSDKKPRKSRAETAPAPPAVSVPTPTATHMRVNNDEPAPLAQVVQAATAPLTSQQSAPVTQDMKSKVVERMTKLRLTASQIKTVLDVVGAEDMELTKLFKLLYEVLKPFMDETISGTNASNVAGLTINKLKSNYPLLYATWSKE